ncbi:hypothetical protein KFL_000860380 [Klebsormidium nitens]|uniref:Uncharacterized protein n=1 Tax=Klebsormidium nitens TaxID=105231 RepID=A0A1Y1HSQ8_KLENI|nr:hypothetical protein KFL_000860380 [Klebsormidium nitens]|eukprot:GAQ81665.1 hypothetical protein KFL_000860380 [Klebsormidium nitens]
MRAAAPYALFVRRSSTQSFKPHLVSPKPSQKRQPQHLTFWCQASQQTGDSGDVTNSEKALERQPEIKSVEKGQGPPPLTIVAGVVVVVGVVTILISVVKFLLNTISSLIS